ncbi:MAG: polysaccharide biosynthesis tyrosine autokinase [Polyangia bacterium]
MSNHDETRQPTVQGASLVPVSPVAVAPEESGIDVWEYLRILRRRWLLISLCVVVAVGLAAFITLRMTKIYRATTTIRIETQAPQVLGKDVEDVVEMGTGSFWSNVEYYETQYRIIESRDVASRVVREYGLNEDPQFLGVPPEKIDQFEPVSVNEATSVLQGMTTVEPVKDSRLVEIHVDSPSPERAQLYSNALAQAYLDRNLETMLKSTVDAVDWLSDQLDDVREKLVSSEEKLYDYKRENGILSVSLEDRQNIVTAQMGEAATKLTEARARRIELQSRKKAISEAADVEDPMAIPLESLNASPLIQQFKQRYAELSQEYGELSERYGANHPSIIEIKTKIRRIEKDIDREVKNIIAAVDAELSAARATEAGFESTLEDLRQQALELNQKEIDYNRLSRKRDNNEKIFDLLLGRTQEADLSRLLRVNNVETLDAALLPEAPIKPRVPLNLALALVFGLIAGVGLAVMLEFVDRTIKTQEDIENLGLPFLGIVPSIDSSVGSGYYSSYGKGSRRKRKRRKPAARKSDEQVPHDIFVHEKPKSQVAESLRSIRTNLLFMTADRPVRRILITSPSPQEGKTTVAANLAIVMAQSGSRVLLVDTDMRRPRIHKAFGVRRNNRGISTMILKESTAEDSIVESGVPDLDLLMCGPTPPNPAELLHTDAFHRVVDDLSARYDRVIFDSPPVGVVTDAAILSKSVDGTVLILKSLSTTRDSVKHAAGVLRDIDSEILGAVLNDLDLQNRRYGRHYYYYYKKYGEYYGSDSERGSSEPEEHPTGTG